MRRVRLTKADRWLWPWLSRRWSRRRTALVIVKPETVIASRRHDFVFGRGKVVDASGDRPVAAEVLQIRLPLSSETRSAPSGATVTPTGRPHCSTSVAFSPVEARKPTRKSSIGPGLPFAIGKNATRYPDATVRFHDPCSATNLP